VTCDAYRQMTQDTVLWTVLLEQQKVYMTCDAYRQMTQDTVVWTVLLQQ